MVLIGVLRSRRAVRPRSAPQYGKTERVFILVCYMWALTIVADVITWGYLSAPIALPMWMRWSGLALGVVCVLLALWTHRALGEYFSPHLQMVAEHQLVTSGPYAWVRHPMYATLLLSIIAVCLVTANAVVWAASALMIPSVIARVGREEAMLTKYFGEQYTKYKRTTGALLPKFR